MTTAFALVNKLENPMAEARRAFELAQAYFESLISDLRDTDGVDGERLDAAGFGFDQARSKLDTAAALFEDVQNGVRHEHWEKESST